MSQQLGTTEGDAINALASSVKTPLDGNGEVSVTSQQTTPPPATQATPASAPSPSTQDPTPAAAKPTEVDFGMEGMPKLISEPIVAKPATAEPTKPAEQQTTDPKVVAPLAPVAPVDPNAPATQQPAARDYTMFPEELATALKKAPNAVYDAVKSHVERTKQLETEAAELRRGALPPSYYEHPQAYQFDRGYQQAAATFQQAEFERQHWTSQLATLRSGKADKITNLVGFNQQTGEAVYQELPVTAETAGKLEAGLMNNLASLAQVAQTAQQQAANIRGGFVQQHQQTVGYLRQAEEKFFPELKDVSKHPRKADYDFFTEKFLPPSMRNHPMAPGLGKAYITILTLQDRVKALHTENESLKRGRVADGAAGPSPSQIQGAVPQGKQPSAKPGNGELSVGMFPVGSED